LTVWDGDQLLFEERHTGSDLTGGAPYYGTIGYIHGGGIDAPLWLLDTRFSDARVLNYNWRGLAESSVWPNGNPADTSLTGGDPTAISWPAGQGVYYRSSPPPGGALTPTWIGSLPSNGQDGTGMLYRRNRYYDPAAGRFTQEDPIGLAGGLNLYGFANGDPVNFSDPFGLFECEQRGNCTQSQGGVRDVPTLLGRALSALAEGWRDLSALSMIVPMPIGMVSGGAALEGLSSAARAADRGGFTRAGRALTKHAAGQRAGAQGFPALSGNVDAINQTAQSVVDDILTNPQSSRVAITSGRFSGGLDVFDPSGRGVRYDASGKFVGFLEPK
jgi:RHS repeat-associated protein